MGSTRWASVEAVTPDFAAAFALIAQRVDGCTASGKGAAARLDQGRGVWDDMMATGGSLEQARDAVVAWVAEQRAAITVTGESGSPNRELGKGSPGAAKGSRLRGERIARGPSWIIARVTGRLAACRGSLSRPQA